MEHMGYSFVVVLIDRAVHLVFKIDILFRATTYQIILVTMILSSKYF